jgi:anaerobic dimethyl sulfoxide reductase subunit C
MKERSLVAFTLLAQTAVGLFFWCLALGLWIGVMAGPRTAAALIRPAWAVAAAFMLAGGCVAGFHLGAPSAAWRALAHWRGSWLSREVLSALVFTGAMSLAAGAGAAHPGASRLFAWTLPRSWCAAMLALAGVSGAALLLSLGRVYRLPAVPAWNHWTTSASFSLSSFLLGSLATGVLFLAGPGLPPEAAGILRLAGCPAILLLILGQVAVLGAWVRWTNAGVGPEARCARLLLGQERGLLRLRLLAALLGALPLAIILALRTVDRARLAWLYVAALILVTISEIAGRVLFYKFRAARDM